MSYEDKLRKVIKYFFILVAALIVIFSLLIFLSFEGGNTTAENRQGELGQTAQKQIVMFYKKNGYYPKSLQDLPVYNDPDFVTLLQKHHTFRYRTYSTEGKSKYEFSWRGDAMNWSGYRCTNYKGNVSQDHHGVVSTYTMPGGTVCTVTDLH